MSHVPKWLTKESPAICLTKVDVSRRVLNSEKGLCYCFSYIYCILVLRIFGARCFSSGNNANHFTLLLCFHLPDSTISKEFLMNLAAVLMFPRPFCNKFSLWSVMATQHILLRLFLYP